MATPEHSSNCLCSTVQFIGNHAWGFCKNLINLDQNMAKLKGDTEYLSSQAEDKNAQLRAEDLARKIRRQEFVTWLEDVDRTKKDVEEFQEEVERSKNNIFKRLRLAQQVQRKIDKVAEVKQRGIFPAGLVIDAPPEDDEIHKEILEVLRFRYDRLENEKLKDCFLYCALYPEYDEIPRNQLIEYWIMEGLIDEMDSREEMSHRGHRILNDLIGANLLEGADGECVSVGYLIKEMSLKIIGTRFYSADQKFEEVPSEVWSLDREKVFLNDNAIKVLPLRPHCPHLTTLLLQRNLSLDSIPDSIFWDMPRLKVLDLSYTSIRSLPKSVSDLENLHALLAGDCRKLEYVPSLEKLKELKELNLSGSQISEVPQGLEELVNLRNLDLFSTKKLVSFDSWKLRRLSKLQRLRIDFTGVEVSAEDLLCLNKLEVVCAKFQNGMELSSYLHSPQCQRLKKYRLYVGDRFFNQFEEIGKEVEAVGIVVARPVFPNDVETLALKGCVFDIKIGSSDIMPWKNAQDLRKFELHDCHGIELIFSENCRTPLRSVEKLKIDELPDLRVLFHEVAPAGDICFKLKKLSISNCSGIKNIFAAMFLQNNFSNLEKLEVSSCENVEEIIADEDVGMSRKTITLPNLKKIRLSDLPALKSIYKGTMVCMSLKDFDVEECPMFKRLPFSCSHTNHCQQHASPTPVFPSIDGEQICRESMESVLFHEVAPACDIFFKLKKLSICDWSGIKNIFPVMLLQNNFPNLEEIKVSSCENVEEIIADEDVEMKTITLPNLKKIQLSYLPALKSIYKGTMVCMSLKNIHVTRCPMLKRLAFVLFAH